MSELPSISVVIPCYNAARTLRESVESVFKQTYQPLEIVCVDDGSTDETPELLYLLKAESPIPFTILSGPNGGASHARNRGTRAARGEYLQYLDADDVLDPRKFEHQARLGESSPALIAASFVSVYPEQDRPHRLKKVEADPWFGLVTASLGITSANLWRRDDVVEAGLWDEGRRTSEDPELVFRLLKRGGSVVIDDVPLTYKKQLPDSLWLRDRVASLLGWWRLRIEIVEYLIASDECDEDELSAIGTFLLGRLRRLYAIDRDLARAASTAIWKLKPDVRRSKLGRAYGTLYWLVGLDAAESAARAARVARRLLRS